MLTFLVAGGFKELVRSDQKEPLAPEQSDTV